MKIYEYQAMALLAQYGIKVAPSKLVNSPAACVAAAESLGPKVVLKAQVLTGARGKAGGIKLANSAAQAQLFAEEMFSRPIKSIPVKQLLVAKAVDIVKEYYLGITVERSQKKIVCLVSGCGGVEIEQVAEETPEQIYELLINPLSGPDEAGLRKLMAKVFKEPVFIQEASETLFKMYKLFIDQDCSLLEINPYAQAKSGELIGLDAKINFDDNSLFKHPELEQLKNPEEYSPDELKAHAAGLSFVSMDGNVGCIVNGAGLAMATMDMIKLFGGQPANFLDVGGSSNPEKVLNALKIILANQKVKVILINIFGGITRCDDIAKGIIMAREKLNIQIPLIIRLIGTNEKEGRGILEKAGLLAVEQMSQAVKKAVELA